YVRRSDVRVSDHGVARGGTRTGEERRQVAEQAATDQDVVRGVGRRGEGDPHRHHFVSGRLAWALAARASTNRRSDSRFRYLRISGETAAPCPRATTARSARRHTVRARCRAAAFAVPPGRMQLLRGAGGASCVSIAFSSTATCGSPTRGPGRALSTFAGSGEASSAPIVNRSR